MINGNLKGRTITVSQAVASGIFTRDEVFLYKASNTFPIYYSNRDDYFNYVTILLNGDANTCVSDASNNNFAITVNGDTRPSAFSPYNTNWSYYFDGTGDTLTWAGTTLSGNFTVECWVFKTAVDASGYTNVLSGSGNQQLYIDNTTAGSIGMIIGGSSIIAPSGTAVTLNQWHHLAWVREGSTCRAYVNGVQQGTGTSSASFSLYVISRFDTGGYEMNGYISNVRITNACLYPSGTTFTPSTSPLTTTVSSGTVQLLTCQSYRIIDNSTNAVTITKNGDVKVTAFGPFTETDTTTGSGYFDGTGDYLTLLDNSAFNLGSGDATIEAWIYPTTSGQTCGIFDKRSSGVNYSQFPQIALTSGAFIAYVSYTGSAWAGTINGATPTVNAWTHVAFVRNVNTWTLYVNGAVSGTPFTAAGSVYTSTDSLVIGASTSAGLNPFAGYITNARIIKGTALYTSAFTPPTSALTAVANTQLLTLKNRIGYSNHQFVDESGASNLITKVGNASQGSFSPFSQTGWGVFFNGSSNSLSVGSTQFLTGSAWTVEMWVNTSSTANFVTLAAQYVASGGQFSQRTTFSINSSTGTVAIFQGGTTQSGSTNVADGRWHHIAFVLSSGTVRAYVDGVNEATFSGFGSPATVTTTFFYDGTNSTSYFNGFASNLRVINSAYYTTAFTPPTAALTAISGTQLLTCQSNRLVDNSTNASTIAVNGSPSVVAFSPFPTSTSYSADTVGGSGYFDGTGDYLTTPNTNQFAPAGDFTIGLWVYPTSLAASYSAPIGNYTGNFSTDWLIEFASNGTLNIYTNGNTVRIASSSGAIKTGQWYYIALCRSGSTITGYLNGSAISTYSQSGTFGSASKSIGIGARPDALEPFTGYIASVKLIIGSAVTSVPTLPFTSTPGTSLLCNFTSGGVINASSKNVIETAGNARTINSTKKYGTGSLAFDGSGDYLYIPSSPDSTLASNFTIEGWAYLNASGNYRFFSVGDTVGSSGIEIYVSSGNWVVYSNGAVRITGSSATRETWTHLAVVRSGSTVTLYVNGTASGSTWSSSATFSGAVYVGAEFYNSSVTSDTNGYIDDFRITNGIARYTTSFVAPISAFPVTTASN